MKHIFTIFLCSILLVFGGCQAEEELVEKTSTEPFEVSAEAFCMKGQRKQM